MLGPQSGLLQWVGGAVPLFRLYKRKQGRLRAEPCAGTHLANTADEGTLLAVGLRTPAAGLRSVCCLTGPPAWAAMHEAVELGLAVDQLGEVVRARVAEGDPAELAELARELGVLRAKVAERRLQGGRADRQMVEALAEQQGEPFFLASLAPQHGTNSPSPRRPSLCRARCPPSSSPSPGWR